MPADVTRRTVLQKVRGSPYTDVPQLVDTGFQVLFHSPPGVLFTFPSQYSFAIGHWVVFSLGGWSPLLPTRFHVSRSTPDTAGFHLSVLRGFHPLWLAFPKPFSHPLFIFMRSIPRHARTSVWALPISLAATLEIDFSFSSSPYLDVSVQEVPSVYLCIQYTVTEVFSARFPHSDIHASLNMCFLTWLFAAYHVLHRLPVPRHPPCALLCLTICFRIYSVICFRFD